MSEHARQRVVVPVSRPDRSEVLVFASEAALLDRAQDVSRATVERLELLLGDEADRLLADRGGAARSADAQPASRSGPVGRRLHVLVVENRVEVRDSLCMLLGLWGYAVTGATDGPEAIAAAWAFPPDVVLMDIGLPTIDGYETARRIRRIVGGSGPRFVAVTGRGRDPDRERSRSEGFAIHLQKPVEPWELRDALAGIAAGEVAGAACPS